MITVLLMFSFRALCFDLFSNPLLEDHSKSLVPDSFSVSTFSLNASLATKHLRHLPKSFTLPKSQYNVFAFWFQVFNKYDHHHAIFHDKHQVTRTFGIYSTSSIDDSDPIFRDYAKTLYLSHAIETVRHELEQPLSFTLRIQTGQADYLDEALRNIEPYYPTISSLFKQFNLPNTLISLSLLESHFELDASSLAGAVGPWQFMPLVAKYFLPTDEKLDYRLSPYLSTLAAIHLLKQNKMILKTWPKAILAYNTGVTFLRRLGAKKRSFESLISHPKLGFAAKNYYPEFLAVSSITFKSFEIVSDNAIFQPYISRCPSSKKLFKGLYTNHNFHLKTLRDYLPRGIIVFSDTVLPESYFIKVPKRWIIDKKPRKWLSLLKNHSCSTK